MQKEETPRQTEEQPVPGQQAGHTSKNVSDHLANERTFLAWMRTGLATITFGFVVERFGLLLRELGLKGTPATNPTTIHYSAIVGVTLTVLGVIIMCFALANFLRTRRAIDEQRFRPPATFAIVLTALACMVGLLLAVYLLLTS